MTINPHFIGVFISLPFFFPLSRHRLARDVEWCGGVPWSKHAALLHWSSAEHGAGPGGLSARSISPARPCNQPYPELTAQESTSGLIPPWLSRLGSQAGMGSGVPQGSRYSCEHLKHLPLQPSARLGAASPRGRWQRCSVPGTGVPSPRGCRSGGSLAQPAGTTTSQRLLLRGEGACLGGHAAGWSPAPLSPVPHGRSSVQATWHRLASSVAMGRREPGWGALISSFKANISLQRLCKPLFPTG